MVAMSLVIVAMSMIFLDFWGYFLVVLKLLSFGAMKSVERSLSLLLGKLLSQIEAILYESLLPTMITHVTFINGYISL